MGALKAEFRSVADLTHPGLCAVYELAVSEACAFLVMEFVDGVDFCSFVRRSSSAVADQPTGSTEQHPTPPVAAEAAIDHVRLRGALLALAEAVHALHESGRLHRDLKPSNILVSATGRVVVVDFGLLDDGSSASTGPWAGTPAFMAPEQVAGLPAEPASDWYAFGVTLFLAITGVLPGAKSDRGARCPDALRPSQKVVDVPADLDDLCASLLCADAGARPTGAQVLSVLGRATGPTQFRRAAPKSLFLGRTAELAILYADLARVEARGSGLRWIGGGSGMGKSALLRQFLSEVETSQQPPLVLRGRCFACEAVPYKAFDAVVEALAAHLARPDPEASPSARAARHSDSDAGSIELAAMFPSLATVLGKDARGVAGVGDMNELRARGFSALRELMRSLCEKGPVIIAVDDLQWGDADSAQLVRELMAPPGIEGLLFIGTFRHGEEAQSPFLRELAESTLMDSAHVIHLNALANRDAVALARACVGNSTERADFIAAESSGNPFLIETLARYQDCSSTREARSLDRVVLSRVERLSAGPRRLLELVSVAAQSIHVGEAFAAASLGPASLPSLRELLSSSLVRAGGVGDADPIEAYHDRIREVVVGSLSATARTACHRTLAVTLEGREAAPEMLAQHFLAAGETEAAVKYALQAAERAMSAMAFDRAAHFYEIVFDSGAPPGARAALGVARANALINAGRCAEAGGVLLLAAAESQPHVALDLRRKAAEQLLVAGCVVEGTNLLRSVADAIGLSFPGSPAAAMTQTALRLVHIGVSRIAFNPPPKAEPADQARLVTAFAAARGLSAFDMARGAFFSAETLRLALRTGDRVMGARSLAAVGTTLTYASSKPLVRWGNTLLRDAERIAAQTNDAAVVASVRVHQGIALMTAGRWSDSLQVLEPAVQTLKRDATGYQHERGYGEMTALLALEALGRWQEVERRAEACLREGEATGNLYLRVQAALYLAQCSLARDVPNNANPLIRLLDAWPAIEDGFLFQHWLGLRASAFHALYSDEPRRAYELVEGAWSKLDGSGLLTIAFVRILAIHLRANVWLALAAKERANRTGLLERAKKSARSLAREGLAMGAASAAFLRATIASQMGNPAAAISDLAKASTIFRGEAMGAHAACAERALGVLLSGREGARRVLQAERDLRAQGIANPTAWSRTCVPGMTAAC